MYSRPTYKPAVIYSVGLGLGLLYWLLDSIYDYLTFAQTIRQMIFHEPLRFVDALLLNVPSNDIIARASFLVACFVVAFVLHQILARETRTRLQLQESESRFRFLSNVANEGLLIHDAEHVLHVNKAFTDITGLSCEGWPLQHLMRELAPPHERDRVQHALMNEHAGPVEFSPLPLDSTEFVEAQTRPGSMDGRRVRVVCVRDISAQKDVEARLTRERNLLRTVIDRSEDIIFLTDRVGRFQLANTALARFFGVASSAEILGRTMTSLLPHLEASRAANTDARILQSGVPEIDFEETWPTPQGETKRFSTTKAPVPDEHGTPTGIVATMRDVTDRRAREKAELDREAALASSRAKSRFLAHMSHEIRTPLNSVLGAAELLRETSLSPSQGDLVNLLESSGKVLSALVGDILDLSKIESGRMQLDKEDFDLDRLMEETLLSHRAAAAERAISVNLNLDPSLPRRVLGDPVRLRQVLYNIVGNAVKFTKKGTVDISVTKDRERHILRFQVADTGIGISKEQHRLIFQSFTQGRADTTREFGGTGLGLAIARHLVELMDGTIHLRSTLGRGSIFTFTACLPEVPTHQAPGVIEDTPPTATVQSAPVRVLLVEDNRNNQLLTRHFLKGPAYTIDVAENGSEALERFYSASYDVVLMDMEMPIMDGYMATERIREAEKTAGNAPTPIIALTANAFTEARQRCMSVGCTDYLAKPLSKQELTRAIHLHLESGTGPPCRPRP